MAEGDNDQLGESDQGGKALWRWRRAELAVKQEDMGIPASQRAAPQHFRGYVRARLPAPRGDLTLSYPWEKTLMTGTPT